MTDVSPAVSAPTAPLVVNGHDAALLAEARRMIETTTWSQTKIAAQLDISQTTLSSWKLREGWVRPRGAPHADVRRRDNSARRRAKGAQGCDIRASDEIWRTLMKLRHAGRLGRDISEIGFGAWAIGGSWGAVDEKDAVAALNAALDGGVTFIDTADAYGGGRSEQIIGRVLKVRGGSRPMVATKCGRGGPNTVESYTRENLKAYVERSLANLGVEALDLLQLHCPPTKVYYMPEIFGFLDELVAAGKLKRYGVSVEKVEEGLKAIEYAGVASVQIIYNIFRQRPARLFFSEAKRKGVAIIARVPLASGMLTGKMTKDTKFVADDHRQFNRHGEKFDKGETFAGVPYEESLAAVDELRPLVPAGATMAAFALRWILMNDAVTTVIPGARNAAQAGANAAAADLPALSDGTMAAIGDLYQLRIAPWVEQRW